MTNNQFRYIQGLVEGKTKMQSALDAGYSRNTALTASQNIESPLLLKEIDRFMEEKGLTESLLVEKIKQGLEAIQPYGKYNYDDVPDHGTRLKFLILCLRLKGYQV